MRARDPGPPRADAHLDHCFEARIPTSGDRAAGHDPGMRCGIGRRYESAIAYAAQTGTANTPAEFRPTRLVRLADRLNFPTLTLIDTPGAANRRSGGACRRGLRHRPSCPHARPDHQPVIGEGGALALGSPTNLWIASDAYFAVIAPEAATAILTRGPHEAPAITTRLRLRAQDLLELDLVRDIAVPEPGRSRRRHAHLRHVMLRHHVPEVLAGQGFLPRWRRLWERARDRRCRRPRTDPSVRC